MPGQVFYRKWRPQRFADVVGQEYVTQTLLNALSTGRVAHAYLLCGPRGTGKTSTGRIMAKALNCLRNGKGEPCNECAMCRAIMEGRAIDLIEIDAASNRGIDDMRSLREKVNFAPNEARYKVYIIDEVHMLTNEAFNAVLKTLEEPPPRTVFILATTDPQKLLPTIVSRCQRFDFRKISLKDVVDRLAKLCHDEGIEASAEVLRAVARSAGGSLRDAENLMEQLVVGYGTHLDIAQLRDALGLGGERQVRDLAAAALSGDVSGGLRVIGEAVEEGLDLRQFHRQVVDYLRAILLVKSGVDDGAEDFHEARDEVKAAAARASLDQVLRTVKLFSLADMKGAGYSPLPLELALVEAATAPLTPERIPQPAPARRTTANAPAISATPQPATRPGTPPPTPPVERARTTTGPTPTSAPAGTPTARRAVAEDGAERPAPAPRPAAPAPQPASAHAAQAAAPAADGALGMLRANWQSVIAGLKQVGTKYKIDTILRSGAEAVSVSDSEVVIAFSYPKFEDMMRQELENPGSKRALEEALAKVLGQRRPVRCIVQPKQKNPGGHLVRAALDMGARKIEEDRP